MAIYDYEGTTLATAYDVNGDDLPEAFDVDGESVWSADREWKDTATIAVLPQIDVTGIKQGGCTDGEYIYQCSGDSTNYTYMKIVKYKISDATYTVVQYNGTPNFGHANDMTYNPKTGYLYVCTMLSDGSIIVLNASDLSYVDTIYVTDYAGDSYAVWQFCYDRIRDVYYSACGGDLCEYDADWNCTDQWTIAEHPEATGQGCETDGAYLYRITYNPNLVSVCKLSGEFVKDISNPVSGEPEAIMYDWHGNWYFSKYTQYGFLYTIELYE